MKNKLKGILTKFLIVKHLIAVRTIYSKYKRDYNNKNKKMTFINILFKTRIIDCTKNNPSLYDCLSKIKYKKIQNDGLIYYLDTYKYIYCKKIILGNLSIDYSKILSTGLYDIFKNKNGIISEKNARCLKSLEKNIDSCIESIKRSKREDKEKFIKYFENIKKSSVNSFEESLQRILWYNQILWQTNHTLIGLGKLDEILGDMYKHDIDQKIITKLTAKKMIKNFISLLHENYWFKSNSLMGDTGQIIVLGGIKMNGQYYYNDLTYLFIECIKELQIPEPKTLLRVSNKMPDNLLQESLESIKTGIGSPLFSNDDIVVKKLIDFGIKELDAYNYITSACWEPIIPGKSVAQNNICSIIFIKPFNELLEKESLSKFHNIDEILKCYDKYLSTYIDGIVNDYLKMNFQKDELLSSLTDYCNDNGLDVIEGGAEYNHIGFTTVSMANLVESLINIDDFVFKNKNFTLEELNNIKKNNYDENDNILTMLKNNDKKFGDNNKLVVDITNKIFEMTNNIIARYNTKYGGKYKIGLSSPSYISDANYCYASLDGRKNFEPFSVHISSKHGNYIELVQFASRLNYSKNRINGNVIDFIVSPNLLNNNMEKFQLFIKNSIKEGFFQMQMNVLSSETLIKAKSNPELFPNLIVRVWGFSAYFNDLPSEYKDLIIKRAIESES